MASGRRIKSIHNPHFRRAANSSMFGAKATPMLAT
jgi:hypothetical protein